MSFFVAPILVLDGGFFKESMMKISIPFVGYSAIHSAQEILVAFHRKSLPNKGF